MVDKCTVWSDLGGTLVRVGLVTHAGRRGEFNYVDPYLDSAGPAIDPINLKVAREVYRTGTNHGVFGVIDDTGPDSWGRRVLKTLEPEKYATAGPLDLLLMSSGYGIGSLMLSRDARARPRRYRGVSRAQLGGAAESAHTIELGGVPAANLRELMRAATSAGGAHPKIQVTDDDGTEWIAKFRSVDDVIETPRVEYATMQLARLHCGINAARVDLSAIGERSAVLVKRFDREHGNEHYASAHALWNRETAAADATNTWATYAGIVALRQALPGEGVSDDAVELFRRMVFNVIIGNTDDHGRNHGFLMDPAGKWRLAPAFDVLPAMRNQVHVHALGIGPRGPVRSFENVLGGVANFGLDAKKAAGMIREIGDGVRTHYPRLLQEARCTGSDRDAVLARCMFPDQAL